MIGLPGKGFVMLSLPKCASTTLVRSIQSDAELILQVNPSLKHINAKQFHDLIVPVLKRGGYAREDYEVCSMFREPVEWLESWWRYRSRPALLEENPARYTGDQSFEDFAKDYMQRDKPLRGRPSRFIAMSDGLDIGVDRIFRLETPEVWQAWLVEKLGDGARIKTHNVSSERKPPELSRRTRKALVEYFAPEYDVYEHTRESGMWTPPPGYVSGSRTS